MNRSPGSSLFYFSKRYRKGIFCSATALLTTNNRLLSGVSSPVNLIFDVYEPPRSSSKTPVVILHGLLGSKTNWKSLAKIIAARSGRKVYSLDARNHGDSPHDNQHDYFAMSADTELFMKNQNIDQCVLLGHSMGGRTAMVTALQKPSLVERLVIVDVSPLSPKEVDLKAQSSTILQLVQAMRKSSKEIVPGKTLTEIRRSVDRSIANDIHDIGLRQFVLTNLKEDITDKELKIHWRINLEVLENSVISGLLHFPRDLEQKTYLGDTLFICGSKSSYLRPEDHSSVRKFFPTCKIEYVEGAGHWVHAEKPTEFLRILLPFL